MYKIQVARVKLSDLISKSKFMNTDQMSIHLFPVMHLCALHNYISPRVILSLEAPNKFGKSIPEFGETHSSVLGCERRPVSASIMSRSYFASFPVCVYKFWSHYLNNIIFIDNSLGPLATESPCSTVGIQLHVSALYVGHLQVVI